MILNENGLLRGRGRTYKIQLIFFVRFNSDLASVAVSILLDAIFNLCIFLTTDLYQLTDHTLHGTAWHSI